jgi:hypothetical protein
MTEETSSQDTEPDDGDWPPPTAPADFGISLQKFATEEEARKLGGILWSVIQTISGLIDMERLDGVTVSFDYDEALSTVDRGMEGLRPLSRSDGEVVGIAMSPAVLRNGVVKVHLVFSASYIWGLMSEEGQSDDYRFALGVIAHECAHVEVTKHRDEAFPGTILRARYDDYEAELFGQIADICWEEYAACRAAAVFSSGKSDDYAEGLQAVVKIARDRSSEAIRSYRRHHDINRVVNEAGTPLCEPLKLASYLLGHLDGCGKGWEVEAEARGTLEEKGYTDIIDKLHAELRALWDKRGEWQSPEEFTPLREIVRDTFAFGGLYVGPGKSPGQGHINIPFTPETMPL